MTEDGKQVQTLVEVHIAVPKLKEVGLVDEIRDALAATGWEKTKHFLRVKDINPLHAPGESGHDLADPGTMSTGYAATVNEGMNMAAEAMELLRGMGIEGMNFEIERLITSDLLSASDLVNAVNIQRQMIAKSMRDRGFEPVNHAPVAENHLIYKGLAAQLPTYHSLQERMTRLGFSPSQIVTFAYQPDGVLDVDNDLVTQVATIYKPTAQEAWTVHQNLLPRLAELGNPRLVTEEVLYVGAYSG